MSKKTDKSKMIIFLVNTIRQPLYVIQQATRSNPELDDNDTLIFVISTEEKKLREEETDIEIQKLSACDNIVVESEYKLYKISVLRDEDLIFDGQYSYYDDERIAVATLVKRELANLN